MIVGGGGGPDTTTTELHEAVALRASIAVQLNAVDPTGNSDPDGGEHVVDTGGVPPLTTGLRVMRTALPVVDDAVGAGQVIFRVVVPSGVCPVTWLEYALSVREPLYAWTAK